MAGDSIALYWDRRRRAAERARLGLLYACGCLGEDDARSIRWQLNDLLGEYPLSMVSAESIADCVREEYQDHPKIREWAEEAAARVYRKWDGDGEDSGAAVDWGRDLVLEYAKEDGVELQELPDEAIVEEEAY